MFKTGRICNHILDALPVLERKRLTVKLEEVELPLGAVVHESGSLQTHAYFPLDCIVSLLYVPDNQRRLERTFGPLHVEACDRVLDDFRAR